LHREEEALYVLLDAADGLAEVLWEVDFEELDQQFDLAERVDSPVPSHGAAAGSGSGDRDSVKAEEEHLQLRADLLFVEEVLLREHRRLA